MPRLLIAVVVILYVALGTLYAALTPKWQAPDEPAHFNYVRTIAETGTLPVLQFGDYDQDYLERIKAARFPSDLSVDSIRYESYQPPLYYLAATPVYLVARAGGLDAEVLAIRLFSVLLGALVLIVAFAGVMEIMNDEWLALATAGLMATVPMYLAITASVSNDTAANLVVALILLVSARRLKGTIGDRRFIILGGLVLGAALLTKTTTYVTGGALLIAAEALNKARRKTQNAQVGAPSFEADPNVIEEMPSSHSDTHDVLRFTNYPLGPGPRQLFVRLVPLFLLAAAVSSPMLLRNMLVYGMTDPLGMGRHDAVVVGQRTTAEMIAQRGTLHVLFDFVAISFKSFWAQFGWMGVLVNDRIYVALSLLTAAAVLGLLFYAVQVVRRREQLDHMQWEGIGLLALLLVTALAAYIGYNFKFFQPQGRYLFPGLIPIALFSAIGLREIIAREHLHAIAALLYVAMLGLDIACLFLFIVPQLRIAN